MSQLKRLQRVLFLAIGVSLLGGASMLDLSGSAYSVDVEPMLADHADTWKKLLTEKEFKAAVKVLSAEIDKSTKSAGVFNRAFKKMEWTGYNVALLGNAGTLKFDGELANKAAALRDAGLNFAKAAKKKQFPEVKKMAAVILSFPDKIEPAGEAKPTRWIDLIPIEMLMKEVSSLDGEFDAAAKDGKSGEDLGTKSVLMACLGVVAREYKAEKDWQSWCDLMRAESINLAREFAKGGGVKKAYDALSKSCNDCHDKYRKEE